MPSSASRCSRPPAAPDRARAALIFVVCGPGGVGKGTIIGRLVDEVPGLWLSRSWTTRRPRLGEREDAYTFVDRATFDRAVEDGKFLEWASILGELYGTPMPELEKGQDAVLEIDVQGARQVRERWADATCILVLAPSRVVQEQRLRDRGDSDEHIARRIALGESEEQEGRGLADFVVYNDQLDEAVAQLAAIIEDVRRRGVAR